MAHNALTRRERVRLALAHEATDHVPISLIGSAINAPAYIQLDAYLRERRGVSADAFLEDSLDAQAVAPGYVGPALAEGVDLWGVRRRPVSYGLGCYDEIEHYPLAEAGSVDEVLAHDWPTADWFDYEAMRPRIDALRRRDCAIWAYGWGNIFETAWYMRGFERMFMDFVLHPELAAAILTRVTDFYVEHYRRLLRAGRGDIDIALTGDDLGSQTGPLMSPAMWREQIMPHHVRLNAAIREFGTKIAYHCDGSIMPLVGGFIDMGIDILEALQFDAANMDPAELKRQHGDTLCFAGGVSVQHTLPFGTVEDVRRETRMLIDTLGANGGYICGPAHAIQAGTPPENIVAMFDEALGAP
ncbi:MAG: hypothetical protein FWE88_05300 [Phycisphaerae bacterium]|nr:hypothetical protein [Phycisphaerae bacterium]